MKLLTFPSRENPMNPIADALVVLVSSLVIHVSVLGLPIRQSSLPVHLVCKSVTKSLRKAHCCHCLSLSDWSHTFADGVTSLFRQPLWVRETQAVHVLSHGFKYCFHATAEHQTFLFCVVFVFLDVHGSRGGCCRNRDAERRNMVHICIVIQRGAVMSRAPSRAAAVVKVCPHTMEFLSRYEGGSRIQAKKDVKCKDRS